MSRWFPRHPQGASIPSITTGRLARETHNKRILMLTQLKNILLALFCVSIMVFVGCGLGIEEDKEDDKKETSVTMDGDWEGVTSWDDGYTWSTDLELNQEDDTITGGRLVYNSDTNDPATFLDLSGTINGEAVEIRAFKTGNDGSRLEVVYTGSLAGLSFSGDGVLYRNDNVLSRGTFTVSKNSNNSPNPPDRTEITEVPLDACFTFATGSHERGNCYGSGDIYIYDMGDKADLGPASREEQFCMLEGSFFDLDSIPEDYSGCRWDFGVEGYDSENRGFIVRDAALAHHYKLRIVENQGGTIRFEYRQID